MTLLDIIEYYTAVNTLRVEYDNTRTQVKVSRRIEDIEVMLLFTKVIDKKSIHNVALSIYVIKHDNEDNPLKDCIVYESTLDLRNVTETALRFYMEKTWKEHTAHGVLIRPTSRDIAKETWDYIRKHLVTVNVATYITVSSFKTSKNRFIRVDTIGDKGKKVTKAYKVNKLSDGYEVVSTRVVPTTYTKKDAQTKTETITETKGE